jgi:hypothetical protein
MRAENLLGRKLIVTCNMQHTTCSGMDYLDLTLQRLMQLHKLAEAAAAKRNQHVAAARARARSRSATTCGPLQHVVRYNVWSATTCGPPHRVVCGPCQCALEPCPIESERSVGPAVTDAQCASPRPSEPETNKQRNLLPSAWRVVPRSSKAHGPGTAQPSTAPGHLQPPHSKISSWAIPCLDVPRLSLHHTQRADGGNRWGLNQNLEDNITVVLILHLQIRKGAARACGVPISAGPVGPRGRAQFHAT